MATKETSKARFDELAQPSVSMRESSAGGIWADERQWGSWSASALNLVEMTFGTESSHCVQLRKAIEHDGSVRQSQFNRAFGAFLGAKADYEKGCFQSLDKNGFR